MREGGRSDGGREVERRPGGKHGNILLTWRWSFEGYCIHYSTILGRQGHSHVIAQHKHTIDYINIL